MEKTKKRKLSLAVEKIRQISPEEAQQAGGGINTTNYLAPSVECGYGGGSPPTTAGAGAGGTCVGCNSGPSAGGGHGPIAVQG